jgi:hypothetical protein
MTEQRIERKLTDKERVQLRKPKADDRVQLGARIPRDLFFALKAASVYQERDGKTPHQHADIVAEAIEDWLIKNGY